MSVLSFKTIKFKPKTPPKQKNNYSSYKSYKLMSDITTIPVSKKFHDWLKSQGKKGESYEDILKRLIGSEAMSETESFESSGSSETDEPDSEDSES